MRAPQLSVSGTGILALVGLAGLGLVGAWVWSKGGVANAAKALASAADDAASGVVKGAGELVGIPDTNADECSRALAEGRTWDASFACPAGRFIGGLTGRETVNNDILDANDARAARPAVTGDWWSWTDRPLDAGDTSTWGAP